MRNLDAEKRFTERLFMWSGTLILVGLITVFVGAFNWIIAEFWGSWPVLTMLLGAWLVSLGMTMATISSISRRGLHG